MPALLPDTGIHSLARWHGCIAAWFVVAACLTLAATRAAAQDDEKDKPLPPQEHVLRTRDGLSIATTFYPSKLGKDAVPVILLHAEKGVRGDFTALALRLQALGHAVIVPDLRGHGDSTLRTDRGRRIGAHNDDLNAMVVHDVEAVKNFLLQRNNAGELNIEKLCLVGCELGSVVALNFAMRDWSWPPLATGKQGQDVKAIALVSPEWSHRGLNINEAIAHPMVRSQISMIVIAGEGGTKELREAERLYRALERFHPVPPPEESARQTLWMRTLPTRLQGAQLLNEQSLNASEMIEKFIELRLVNVPVPWQQRANSLQ